MPYIDSRTKFSSHIHTIVYCLYKHVIIVNQKRTCNHSKSIKIWTIYETQVLDSENTKAFHSLLYSILLILADTYIYIYIYKIKKLNQFMSDECVFSFQFSNGSLVDFCLWFFFYMEYACCTYKTSRQLSLKSVLCGILVFLHLCQ